MSENKSLKILEINVGEQNALDLLEIFRNYSSRPLSKLFLYLSTIKFGYKRSVFQRLDAEIVITILLI